MFTAFPDGWPGAGLLIVRGVVGAAALLQGGNLLVNTVSPSALDWLLAALALAAGGSLVVGFLTPAASAVVAVTFAAIVLSRVAGLPLSSFVDRDAGLFVIADAVAIVLIGPGAFSLDARLFGRREIVIPHDPHAA